MKFSLIASAASLFIMTALAAPSSAGVSGPNEVTFDKDPTYGGSGCPQGTASVVLSPDKTAFTVTMDQFSATAGQNSSPVTYFDRKNCQINAILDIPSGWQFSIETTTYRGFYFIGDNVEAVFAAHYYLTGGANQINTERDVWGPASGNYEFTDAVGVVSWSPCGQKVPLNINSEVRIDATRDRGSSNQISVDSVDGKVDLVFSIKFKWRRC